MPDVLKVLICGGGCGGPSLAFWLAHAGHSVTVVERYPALRASGAQIDLRAQGITVVKRMRLLDAVRSKRADEAGVAFVDSDNTPKATIMANKSGKGAQTFTSEYEIMRGDMVRILYEATERNVNYVFGTTVVGFEQDDNGVTVHFSDGRSDIFDILVGADGQGSRIRKAISPEGSPDPVHGLGLYAAYWMVPRTKVDNDISKLYCTPRRWVMTRTHNDHETQTYFMLREESEELKTISRAPVETQKTFWSQRFADIGWQADRFIKGMQTTETFYCHPVAQVKTNTWSKGRVVLLGDAGYCPSPMTGMGTTCAFVGAYVLAGEICRNTNNLEKAFKNYDRILRPFVTEAQKISTTFLRLVFPATRLGVSLLYLFVSVISFFRIPSLIARFSTEDKGGWQLPDYPELKVPSDDSHKLSQS